MCLERLQAVGFPGGRTTVKEISLHPFTKGKAERLVRFVKENFLLDRVFWNITDLNHAALEWCEQQNNTYHRATDGVPGTEHSRPGHYLPLARLYEVRKPYLK